MTAADVSFELVAIDLDGTLLGPDGIVSPRTRLAVQRVVAAGVKVCFATGRNFTESLRAIEAVGHRDLAIFVGGALVVDTRSGETLMRTRMEPRLASEVCAEFESAGHAALALQDAKESGVDYLVSDEIPVNAETGVWMSVTRSTIRRVPRLPSASHEHTLRVGIVASQDQVEQVRRQLHLKFGGTVVHHSVIVPGKNVEVLEVFDPTVSKWQALQFVASAHRVDPARIVAIGDDVNDLPMIRGAALGVAMGNAHPRVKAVAGRVIESNADDGLAKFLEELVGSGFNGDKYTEKTF